MQEGVSPAATPRVSPEAQLSRGKDVIEQRIEERDAARKRRDFATADRIRAELAEAGVILEDGPQGTTWRRA